MNNKKNKGNYIRKPFFRFIKKILRIFIKKTRYVYLDEKLKGPFIILSNHSAAAGPLSYEFYFNEPFRFWGTYEMNSGLIMTYKYLSYTYYHKKKHWNIHLSRLFCLIAAPVCNLFYKGLNLISTYPDTRFRKSLRESIETIKANNNLIIFPEASENGYYEELTEFHEGFIIFLEYLSKNKINIPIYVSYFKKKERICVFDKPIYINDLLDLKLSRKALAAKLKDRCNSLGKMDIKY